MEPDPRNLAFPSTMDLLARAEISELLSWPPSDSDLPRTRYIAQQNLRSSQEEGKKT